MKWETREGVLDLRLANHLKKEILNIVPGDRIDFSGVEYVKLPSFLIMCKFGCTVL